MSAGGFIPIITDGLVFQLDAANNLCGNVTEGKNIVNPTETGSFVNGLTVNDNSYSFDGVNDYIECGNISTNTSNFTWTAWVKTPSVLSNYKMILSSSQSYLYLSLYNSKFTFDTVSNGVFRFGPTLNTNTWYSVTIVRESNVDYAYINGGVISSKSDSTQPAGPIYHIGNWAFNNTNSYLGSISQVKIYNRALTPTEVAQNYEATKYRFT